MLEELEMVHLSNPRVVITNEHFLALNMGYSSMDSH
jgi:hypothetical protein